MREVRREVSLDQGLSGADQERLTDNVAPSPGSQLVAVEEAVRLRAALERLPENYRRVIQLRNWEERSFVEIGERLERSDEAARKLWARAIDRLRGELLGGSDHCPGACNGRPVR
jgi:RNA polymerase sigma-70 factor, ECF subfamily